MNITIRREQPGDYRAVEELTRDAFWGSMGHETTDGEPLLVHKLRGLPSFVPELDLVAESAGRLVGHIIYNRAGVLTPKGREVEVLNFGPLSVAPDCKGKGVGGSLMRHSIAEAKRLGYRAIIFFGHPDYYPRFGFRRAAEFGITTHDGASFDALMAMPLYGGALHGITGCFKEDPAYAVDPAEAAAFDDGFPSKEPIRQKTVEEVRHRLPPHILTMLQEHNIRLLADLLSISGTHMLGWDGMRKQDMILINKILTEHGYPKKVLAWHYEGEHAAAETE